jgi:hypothetical protein
MEEHRCSCGIVRSRILVERDIFDERRRRIPQALPEHFILERETIGKAMNRKSKALDAFSCALVTLFSHSPLRSSKGR